MDLINLSIENVAKQFLVEGKEIENRDGPFTTNDYIPTPNDIPVDLMLLIKANSIIIIRGKKDPQTKMISHHRRRTNKIKGK